MGGRYTLSEYDADIIVPPPGTANAWVTIRGETGNRPVLAGRDNLLTAIDLSGMSYVRIENLEITHDAQATGEAQWFREGVEVLGEPGHHLVFRDLYIHHIDEYGMTLQEVEQVEIVNCRLEYCGFGALGGPEGAYGGWRHVTIRDCSLSWGGHYYQGGDGSNRPYDRPDGFGIEPSQGPILIENTIAEHNYGDALDSKAANTTTRRCIVANNSCDGVKVWADNSRIENTLIYGRGDGKPEVTPWAPIVIDQVEQAGARFEIVNVTVDDQLGNEYLLYVQYENPVPVQVTIRNCIFSGRGPNTSIYVHGNSTLGADHNLFFIPQSTTLLHHGTQEYDCGRIGGLGEGNLCGDPRFIQTGWGTAGDYRLSPGSPAIDAGTTLGAPTTHLEGHPRDAHPDIGAYEFGSTGLGDAQPSPGAVWLLQNYPNPFNPCTTIRFALPQRAQVRLDICDALGKEVRRLANDRLAAGEHRMAFDAHDLPAGIYFLRLEAVEPRDNLVLFREVRKLVLLR
ncbi:MAG: right-handed parallel beta-helix repeat-containing protein [candidate division KSB1 bacterium]|nr:right-handed parallel beta-helix repeat-containing protein [candidate division KSB1 bacterium]